MKSLKTMNKAAKVMAISGFAFLSALMSKDALAGQFCQDAVGTWYRLDNGGYLKDGVFEYDGTRLTFDSDGYIVKSDYLSNDRRSSQRIASLRDLSTYANSNLYMNENGMHAFDLHAWEENEGYIRQTFDETPYRIDSSMTKVDSHEDGHNVESVNVWNLPGGGHEWSHDWNEGMSSRNDFSERTDIITRDSEDHTSIDAFDEHFRHNSEYMHGISDR